MVWTFPDPVPIHREPLYTPRRDLVADYPTYEDRKSFYRLPTRYASIQADDHSKEYPLILTSGRLVEYEGGGEETALQSVARGAAAGHVRGDQSEGRQRPRPQGRPDGSGSSSPEGRRIKVKTMVTRRVAPGVVLTPFHFGGLYQGKDLLGQVSGGHGTVRAG